MAKIQNVTTATGLSGLALNNVPEDLLSAIDWDVPGSLLKPGSRSVVTRVEIGETSYVFKQYKSLGLHRRIRYALTRSRARQSWKNGQLMADFGLPVVRPLAFFEESKFGIPGRSLLIMPFQKGTPLNEYPHPEKVLPFLEEIFQTMSRHRITHGDLKATNILIDEDANPHFIDIDASQIHRSKASYLKARQKDEARFQKNWVDDPNARKIFQTIFS